MKLNLRNDENKRILKFLITGGCSTLLDFTIYYLLSMLVHITIAKAISMCCASIFSYFVNKRITFNYKKKTTLINIIKFYVVFGINMGVNISVNTGVYYLTHMIIISFAAATLAGMTVNYLGQRFFVFR